MDNKIEINDNEKKIIMQQTSTFNQDELLDSYRAQSMALAMAERKASEGPQRVTAVKIQIQVMEETIKIKDEKIAKFVKIFEENKINVEKRIKKLRDIYTDQEIMDRFMKIGNESKTEIHESGDGYTILTSSVYKIEDMLLEYMSMISRRPERLEKLLQEHNSIERLEKATSEQLELIEKIKEKLNAIKDFFAKREKDIDKLLDEQAKSRNKKSKVAQTLTTEVKDVEIPNDTEN